MKGIRWTLWVPLVLFGLFVAVVSVQLIRPSQTEVESAMIGKPLPAFTLKPASPDRSGLSDTDFFDGKPKLLNIWASWCIPCRAEAPQLEALKQAGVPIYAVAVRDRPEDVAAFLAQYGNPFAKIGADDLSEVQLGIGSSGVPETFVVDGKGVIRYQHIGEIRPEHVSMLIEKLKEAE